MPTRGDSVPELPAEQVSTLRDTPLCWANCPFDEMVDYHIMLTWTEGDTEEQGDEEGNIC